MDTDLILSSWIVGETSDGTELLLVGVALRSSSWSAEGGFFVDFTGESPFIAVSSGTCLKGSPRTLDLVGRELFLESPKDKEALEGS